ncbi:MAG: SRPBCC family protein [Acidimicrobiales bacterium]
MKLENRFTVPVDIDRAWQVLLDVERIAPCMPGATLTGRDGEIFTGTVKVKVGPVNLTYGGTAQFSSLDEAARVAVVEATGKETRGTGTARATITYRLHEAGPSTDVEVETDLAITGKPAQFGRGVLAEVSAKLVTQFAACLAEEMSFPLPAANGAVRGGGGGISGGGSEQARETAGHGGMPGSRPSVEVVDLLGTAGTPVLKRVVPVLAGLAVAVVVVVIWRRRLLACARCFA